MASLPPGYHLQGEIGRTDRGQVRVKSFAIIALGINFPEGIIALLIVRIRY